MYVFRMPANVTKTKIVAVTAQLDTTESIIVIVIIMCQGGKDDASLTSLTITAPDSVIWHTIDNKGTLADSSSTTYDRSHIGAVMKLDPPPSGWASGYKHVVIVGAFSDGPRHVFLDTFI